MQSPGNHRCGWSLAILLTLAFTSNTSAQTHTSETPTTAISNDNRFESRVAFDANSPRTKAFSRNTIVDASEFLEIAPANARRSTDEILALQIGDLPARVQITERPQATIAQHDAWKTVIESRVVACRAAAEWLPAKQLYHQAQSVQEIYCKADDCARELAEGIARFMRMQALNQQDLAVAGALRAYYARSAIVEQFDLLKQAVALLQKQSDRQAALQQKGMAAAIDLTNLDRESIRLSSQELQLRQKDEQLKRSINDATAMQFDWQASTVEPLEVRAQILDAKYLEQFACSNRHDLLALRYFGTLINSETAPALSSLVSGLTGIASLPLPKRCLLDRMFSREDNSVLACNLKQSIALSCESLEASIRRDVSEKSGALELAYRQIELAKKTAESWEKRVEQLGRLAERGDSRPADIAAAESSLLESKGDEVQKRLDAKLAEIALSEACGGLYQRCCNGLAWLITAETR